MIATVASVTQRSQKAMLAVQFIGFVLIFAGVFVRGAETDNAPSRLRVGIVQMSLGQNLAGLEIRKGDDIRVDADGEGGRLDYVQLDFVEP